MIGGLLKSTSSLAIVAAAGMFIGGLTLTPASAADLGGDCCADLEERVADLEATTARKGNRKVSLKISGWIQREVVWLSDDDGDSEFSSTGATHTGSRLMFSGSAKLSANWTAGYKMRFRFGGNVDTALADAGQRDKPAIARDLEYVYLKNKQLGTLVVGQAYAPSKSIANITLGGDAVVDNAGNWNKTGVQGFELEQSGNHSLVAYISPTVAGFTLAAAWLDLDHDAIGDEGTDGFDVALRYANEFGPLRVAAGIAYTTVDNDIGDPAGTVDANGNSTVGERDGANITGSIALLHTPTGLNVNFAAGKEQDGGFGSLPSDDRDRQFWHVGGGINQNFFGPGNTSVYGEYGVYNNDAAAGANLDEVTMWGLGVVQHFDSAATELYVAYRTWEGENEDGSDLGGSDVQMVRAGMRIKF